MDTQEIILFDTDVTIDYLRKNTDIIDFVNQYGRENMFINCIVRMEVLHKVLLYT